MTRFFLFFFKRKRWRRDKISGRGRDFKCDPPASHSCQSKSVASACRTIRHSASGVTEADRAGGRRKRGRAEFLRKPPWNQSGIITQWRARVRHRKHTKGGMTEGGGEGRSCRGGGRKRRGRGARRVQVCRGAAV